MGLWKLSVGIITSPMAILPAEEYIFPPRAHFQMRTKAGSNQGVLLRLRALRPARGLSQRAYPGGYALILSLFETLDTFSGALNLRREAKR